MQRSTTPRHARRRTPCPSAVTRTERVDSGARAVWQFVGKDEAEERVKGDFDGALRFCAVCSKADPSFSAAALLQAHADGAAWQAMGFETDSVVLLIGAGGATGSAMRSLPLAWSTSPTLGERPPESRGGKGR